MGRGQSCRQGCDGGGDVQRCDIRGVWVRWEGWGSSGGSSITQLEVPTTTRGRCVAKRAERPISMFRLTHGGRPVRAPPPPPKADPEYAAFIAIGLFAEAHTDVTTRYVLNDLIRRIAVPPRRPHARRRRQLRVAHKTVHTEPLLLIMTMPWFLVHTGHIRAWTLLHRCGCPSRSSTCACSSSCSRASFKAAYASARHRLARVRVGTAEHDRAFQHRNLAVYATGEASILYAHADTWINLIAARKLADAYGNSTMRRARVCRVRTIRRRRADASRRARSSIAHERGFGTWTVSRSASARMREWVRRFWVPRGRGDGRRTRRAAMAGSTSPTYRGVRIRRSARRR